MLLILGVVKPRWLHTRWRLIKIVCLAYAIGVALLAILQTLGRLTA